MQEKSYLADELADMISDREWETIKAKEQAKLFERQSTVADLLGEALVQIRLLTGLYRSNHSQGPASPDAIRLIHDLAEATHNIPNFATNGMLMDPMMDSAINAAQAAITQAKAFNESRREQKSPSWFRRMVPR